MSQQMYIRVKRKKTTIFLHVDATDTVLEIKQKLQELVEQAPESQQLYKNGILLEDSKKLNDLKIENDDVLAMVYVNPDGSFEAEDITPFSSDKPE